MKSRRWHLGAAGVGCLYALVGFIVAVANAAPPRLPTISNPGVLPKRLVSGSVYGARVLPLPLHATIPPGVVAERNGHHTG